MPSIFVQKLSKTTGESIDNRKIRSNSKVREEAIKMSYFSSLVLFCLLASALGNPLLRENEGFFQTLALNNKISGRIIGGSVAPEDAFPYQVSLQMYGSHFCGGSIINSQWILTAGHCLSRAYPLVITVVVGTNNLSKGGSKYRGEKIIVHPKFSMNYLTGDIALLKVKGEITFSSKVSPIGLPSEDVSKADLPVVVSGWGKVSNNGQGLPTELQYLNSKIYNHDSCLSFSSLISEKNICTFTKYGEGLCNGDSGSPVVLGDIQVGIVSWGNPCAVGSPDIHTKVFSYVSWINENAIVDE
ncbi:chymotrypsin-2-like [Belonocnema kinseyi]|uniref:chymotrypsin-2-like n=1 Tax=Belonocnema kinseyi TaxID=2817044 RepID=UPI00143D135F|nr:chymotrypsin-2-like [Belonocnema kinseyi]